MTLEVRILDRQYKLACEDSQKEQLQKSVGLLEQKLKELRSAMPRLESERLTVMVALSLAQEIMTLNKALQEQTHCQRLLKQMISDTEKALGEND